MDTRTMPWLALASSAALLTAACGASLPEQDPLSAGPQKAEANRQQGEVAKPGRRSAQSPPGEGNPLGGDRIHCYEPNVPDPDSGGEPMHLLRPCFTVEQRTSQDQADEEEAEAERDEQARDAEARHRAVAASIEDAERWACAGLGAEETQHSPFFHREDIVRVEEVTKGGQVLGARVHFRKVPGLDIGWLRRAIKCHEARAAAMGYDPKAMSYCPLMVAPTDTTVEDRGATIAVTITARRDADIAEVVRRAKRLTAIAR